jgi:hypothetical protein
MPSTFEAASGRVKQLVADFRANEKFFLSPACRCDGPDRQIDALADVLYPPAPGLRQAGATAPTEIKIVEGATK